LPVLLGSDTTHLTVFAGNKKAWPLYLSLGNIQASVRNKPSNRCWVLLAYLPIVDFDEPKPLQTPLKNRLFHQCLELVLAPLKESGVTGVSMTDSTGAERLCFPIIASYIADLPEQQLINVAASNQHPTTTASQKNYGSEEPHPPRTKEWIEDRIAEVSSAVDPSDVNAYCEAAKLKGLNGVAKPFWKDMPHYRPELCVSPDILHGLHRFWRDHVLQWALHLVGQKEFDARVKAIEPIIGMRHFRNGVSHLSQWSGREDRELERIFITAIAGAPNLTSRALRSLRCFHEFLYLAQYQCHSDSTLGYLKDALTIFHKTKKIFIDNGARRGKSGVIPNFNIPKLAGLHTYLRHIPEMGATPQFSTEVIETCHQSMAKLAYQSTNKRDYEKQMRDFMDRTDRIALLEELRIWWEKYQKMQAIDRAVRSFDEESREWAHSFYEQDLYGGLVKTPSYRVRFSHVWHNLHPHKAKVSLQHIASAYRLVNFIERLKFFLSEFGETPSDLLFLSEPIVDIWLNCRIQLPSVQDDDVQAATRTIQALPPSDVLPYGRSSCVLIPKIAKPKCTGIKGLYMTLYTQ
jgi:hypothetical protein